jgi:hypothetical protein
MPARSSLLECYLSYSAIAKPSIDKNKIDFRLCNNRRVDGGSL